MMSSLFADPDRRRAAFRAELFWWVELYAAKGLPLFPVAGDKRPLVKWKHGATADIRQLHAWWTRWPDAMIGMKTGTASGLVVLDVDVKNGCNGFETMRANGWQLPADAIEVKTPSGGSHFYFRNPNGQTIRNSAGKIGPGLDIRGEGGFIVLPPSRPTLDGRDYHYAEGQEPGISAGTLIW